MPLYQHYKFVSKHGGQHHPFTQSVAQHGFLRLPPDKSFKEYEKLTKYKTLPSPRPAAPGRCMGVALAYVRSHLPGEHFPFPDLTGHNKDEIDEASPKFSQKTQTVKQVGFFHTYQRDYGDAIKARNLLTKLGFVRNSKESDNVPYDYQPRDFAELDIQKIKQHLAKTSTQLVMMTTMIYQSAASNGYRPQYGYHQLVFVLDKKNNHFCFFDPNRGEARFPSLNKLLNWFEDEAINGALQSLVKIMNVRDDINRQHQKYMLGCFHHPALDASNTNVKQKETAATPSSSVKFVK